MILNAIKDREDWINIISKFPEKLQDIYFHPDYVSLNSNKNNSHGCLFYNIKGKKIWINPFIKIQIPKFEGIKEIDLYDLETAYGYGGPISNTKDKKFILESNRKFLKWVNSNNIVCEFIRFHPIYDTTTYSDKNVEILGDRITCSIELDKVDKDYAPFKSKVKNMIKRAQRQTKSFISKEKKFFNEFKKIYVDLMFKKNAEKETFFTPLYFSKLYEIIVNNGFMSIIEDNKNRVIAIGIFLNGKESSHYHLSASINYKIPGINNLLIYNAATYAKKNNLKILHLGGGNINDQNDKLFKFKASMSTNQHVYHIGKRINKNNIYKNLKSKWKKKYPILYNKYSNRLLCYHIDTEILNA